ncbi:hypothetical protein CsatA_003779 [Cannabis sativa]
MGTLNGLFRYLRIYCELVSWTLEVHGAEKLPDPKRQDVTFQKGDHVFLRVSLMKGVKHFGKKGKLSLRFIGPFEILERIGQVAYRLALPPTLSVVHNVFHVSMLRKYASDPMHILSYRALKLQPDMSYDEQPVQILDKKERVLRTKTIALVKVLWKNSKVEEATWELESDMRTQYPELFRTFVQLEDFPFKSTGLLESGMR